MHPIVLAATGLGAGASPWAPGTVGTLWGLPITWYLASAPIGIRYLLVASLCLIGVWVCGTAARILDQKDPGAVVWDEFVTLPIVFFSVSTDLWRNPGVLIAGFLLHRVFDISKLWPVKLAERAPGGWGIMLDDVVAAIYGAIALRLLVTFGIVG